MDRPPRRTLRQPDGRGAAAPKSPAPAAPHRSPPLSSATLPEGPSQPAGLLRLNQAPPLAAEAALRACCGSHRWARRMAAHRPYPTVDALLAAADEAAYDLTSGDLAEALAGEAGAPLPDGGKLAVHVALRAAHAAYEAKFGHAFVLALDEDDPTAVLDQTLASLRERLCHDEDEEAPVTAEQLRRMCRARLRALAAGTGPAPRALADTAT